MEPTAKQDARASLLTHQSTALPMGSPVADHVMIPQAVPIAAVGVSPQAMYQGGEVIRPADNYHWAATLGPAPGLLLRERTYLSQMLCAACEKRQSYAVGLFNPTAHATSHLDDEQFVASLSPGAFEVREESSCCCRYCLHQARELKLGYFFSRGGQPGDGLWEGGLAGYGWPQGEVPMLWYDRPFRCTLCCCCVLLNPQEMRVKDVAANTPLGGTVMEWACPMSICPYRQYGVVDAFGRKEFDVHVPFCWIDGCRNFCAPTCFNPVFSMPITAAHDRAQEVGAIESHWPGCNVSDKMPAPAMVQHGTLFT